MDYLGIGPGAHGRLALNGARTATTAARRVPDYIEAVRATGVGWAEAAALSPTEAAEERLMLGLRTTEGVALSDLTPLDFEARVANLADEGVISITAGRLVATPRGRKVLDAVIRALLV